jgi:hypothetical protein
MAFAGWAAWAQCGTTWTDIATGSSLDFNAVAYGAGTYVAASQSGTVFTSTDGATWGSQLTTTSSNLYGVAYGNSVFVAVGAGAASTYSANGFTWHNTTLPPAINLDWRAVVYGGGRFVAVGFDSASNTSRIVYSTDGINWSMASTSATVELADVAYGASAYVAVGETGTVLRSTDGTTWNAQTSGVTDRILSVAYGGGFFVAGGEGGLVIRSGDGSTWTSQTSGTGYYLQSAKYHLDRFYLAGEQGTIIASPYGSGWTAQTSGTTSNLLDSAYSGSEIVMVGGGGTVLRNPCGGSSLTVTSVMPNQGPTAGGTSVTIAGSGFASGATVTFGGNAATGVNVPSATSITCTTPAHGAGQVSVTVTNPSGGGSATLANGFTYTDLPGITVTACNPSSGPETGGTNVTITGTGFQSGASVSFGGSPATGVAVPSATSITCATPSHPPGPVNITVTNPGGASATLNNGFTYGGGPGVVTVTACNPNSGPESGGTNVTITGTGFQSPTDVHFGGMFAPGVTVVSTTTLTCQTPPHPPGPVEIQVAVIGVGIAFLPNGFTYGGGPPGPTINGVTRLGSPFRLRLDGSNFHPGCVIRINGNPAPTTSFKSNNRVVANPTSAPFVEKRDPRPLVPQSDGRKWFVCSCGCA